MNSEVNQAYVALGMAEKARRAIRQQRDDLLAQRRLEAEQEAQKAFGASLAEAGAEVTRGEAALEEAQEKAALSEKREISIGTLMEEWKPVLISAYRRGDPAKTGRKGILEVITRVSEHPGNRYPASVGETVIRLIKKNGKLGRDYVKGNYEIANYWRPASGGEAKA